MKSQNNIILFSDFKKKEFPAKVVIEKKTESHELFEIIPKDPMALMELQKKIDSIQIMFEKLKK